MEGDKMDRLIATLSEISESLKVLVGKMNPPEASLLQEDHHQTIKKRKRIPHEVDDPIKGIPNKEESPIVWKDGAYIEAAFKRLLEEGKNSPEGPFSLADVPLFEAKQRPKPRELNLLDVMSRFQRFDKFGYVSDYSDHYYASQVRQQGQPDWDANIIKEWNAVKRQMPENLVVRGYEGRPDLFRAVVIGPEGTPYHDGLFFFDVYFPSTYPTAPPLVHYCFDGLNINPSITPNGALIYLFPKRGENYSLLDLLSIWEPGFSDMLKFLIFLKDIFNATPLLNGVVHGQPSLFDGLYLPFYNEVVFIKSVKTMVAVINNPPKNFEDFVVGHFRNRVNDILTAYQAYTKGVQVGCLVNGVPEGNKGTVSVTFKKDLFESIQALLDAFKIIGADHVDLEFSLPY